MANHTVCQALETDSAVPQQSIGRDEYLDEETAEQVESALCSKIFTLVIREILNTSLPKMEIVGQSISK